MEQTIFLQTAQLMDLILLMLHSLLTQGWIFLLFLRGDCEEGKICRPNCNANKDLDSINNRTPNTEIKMATLLPTFQWFGNIAFIIHEAVYLGNNNR